MMAERGIGLAHTTILRWNSTTRRSLRSDGSDTPDRWVVPRAPGCTCTGPSTRLVGRWISYLSRKRDVAGSVQNRQVRRAHGNDAGNLARCADYIIRINIRSSRHATDKSQVLIL